MHFIYLIFGNDINNYLEANFAILTLLAHNQDLGKVHVVTDQPKYLNQLAGRIDVHSINGSTISEWRGTTIISTA